MDRERRAQEIQRAIEGILLREWDPIGVRDEEQAQDEYGSYVGGVYRLLVSAPSCARIADHLAGLEAGMGLEPSSSAHLLAVAEKLQALDVKLEVE